MRVPCDSALSLFSSGNIYCNPTAFSGILWRVEKSKGKARTHNLSTKLQHRKIGHCSGSWDFKRWSWVLVRGRLPLGRMCWLLVEGWVGGTWALKGRKAIVAQSTNGSLTWWDGKGKVERRKQLLSVERGGVEWDWLMGKGVIEEFCLLSCGCSYSAAKSCWLLWPPKTIAAQAPRSMGFSRQEYWSGLSGLPFSCSGDLPHPRFEHMSHISCTGMDRGAHGWRSHIAQGFWRPGFGACLCAQSRLTLSDSLNCSPPGSCVHGILLARIVEWVAMPFSRDLPDSGIEPMPSAVQADSLPLATGETPSFGGPGLQPLVLWVHCMLST